MLTRDRPPTTSTSKSSATAIRTASSGPRPSHPAPRPRPCNRSSPTTTRLPQPPHCCENSATQPPGSTMPFSATPTGSMSRPSSWLAPRSFRCSTAKPTRSSRNSPASRPGRPSEHTCSRWRLKPVSTHSSTYREPRDSGASAYRSPPATYVADAALVRLVPHSLAAGVREHHSSLSPGVAPKSSRCHPSSRGPCGSE